MIMRGLLRNWRNAILALSIAGLFAGPATAAPGAEDDMAIAQSLAEMLRDARTVISNRQALINDPNIGDKHLTGKAVLDQAVELYREATGADPTQIDRASRQGRLMQAMMAAISEVVDDNQETINAKGTGFKGFIPAVFGRLVAEQFGYLAKGEAEVKVTAPPELVRNRKARPDQWEADIIRTKLLDPAWAAGGIPPRSRRRAGRHFGSWSGVLRGVLPRLSRYAKRRDGHHRIPQGGRQAERSRRCDQHYPLPLNGSVAGGTK